MVLRLAVVQPVQQPQLLGLALLHLFPCLHHAADGTLAVHLSAVPRHRRTLRVRCSGDCSVQVLDLQALSAQAVEPTHRPQTPQRDWQPVPRLPLPLRQLLRPQLLRLPRNAPVLAALRAAL